MVATVSNIKLCQECKGELPQQYVPECPHCDAPVPKVYRWVNDTYSVPTPLHLQKAMRLKDIEELKAGEKDKKALLKKCDVDFKEAFKGLSPERKLNILKDARAVIETYIPHGRASDDSKEAISLAIKVGKVAEAIDNLIKTASSTTFME